MYGYAGGYAGSNGKGIGGCGCSSLNGMGGCGCGGGMHGSEEGTKALWVLGGFAALMYFFGPWGK